jgi:voltage-gated potassium channel
MEEINVRSRLNTIIFGTETPAGRHFDIALIWLILISVLVMMLDSVEGQHLKYGSLFFTMEWIFTGLFTVEYLTRIYCAPNRLKYIFSFYGLVDLISVLPSYLALIHTAGTYFVVIRMLRVMRIFRILKLFRYMREGNSLMRSFLMARRKIAMFFMSVLVLSTIFGTMMYVVEGPENGFTSIPKSIYWTIVTITTVGYGDITPHTVLGQIISTLAMLTGYSIIAIPTGILTAEIAHEMNRDRIGRKCGNCNRGGHERDAVHCKFCGAKMDV